MLYVVLSLNSNHNNSTQIAIHLIIAQNDVINIYMDESVEPEVNGYVTLHSKSLPLNLYLT